MRFLLTAILPLSLIAMQGCDQLQTPRESGAGNSSAGPAVTGEVMATVNGTALTRPVFEAYASQRRAATQGGQDADDATLLDELINLELMRQEGLQKGLDSRPAVAALLDQQQRAVLARAAIQNFSIANPISDEAVRQLYDAQFGGTPGKEYSARHILVKTRDEAVAIIAELDGGADFGELAKEKSTGPSGPGGGDLGWFSPAQMVKPFSEAAAKLEKGSYSKEPVETQFGWHVILLEDVRETTPPEFDTIKDKLTDAVVFDGRNLYEPEMMRQFRLTYYAIGRGQVPGEERVTYGRRKTDHAAGM